MHQEVNNGLIGMRRRDDFEQPQVARRVEKVGAAEMLFKVIAPAFCHQVDGYAGCIGTDKGTRFAVLFYLIINDFLDVEAFYHHFNHPIAGGDILHVVGKIAGGNAFYYVFGKHRARIAFYGCCQKIVYHFVAFGRFGAFFSTFGYHVKQ